jgi:hypothetical protein
MEEMNKWRKRQTVRLECPSGTVCYVQRLGPELALRAGRVARILKRPGEAQSTPTPESEQAFLESLSDEDFLRLMLFAKEVVVETVVTPRIVNNPNKDQLGPDDLPVQDFWFLFNWAKNGATDIPVALEEGETTIEAVQTFPGESPGDTLASSDSEQVQ